MKLDQLTSLRFFAAFGVFLCHFFQYTKGTVNPWVFEVRSFAVEGAAFVGFFYVLSGFIISYSSDSNGKALNVAGFLFRRFARIYPVHLLMLLIFVFFLMGGIKYAEPVSFLLNFSLLHAWHPDMKVFWGFNAVSWSLSCEMFFYLSFLMFVHLSSRSIVCLLALLFVVITVLQLIYTNDVEYWIFYINPAVRMIDFMVGILIFRFYRERNLVWFKGVVATVAELAVVLLIPASMIVAIKFDVSKNLKFDLYYLFQMSVCVAVFAYGRGAVSRLLSVRFLVYLGEASFCLYMIHLMFLGYVSGKYFTLDINDPLSVSKHLISMVVLVTPLSCLLYSLYERPVNKFLLRNWGRSRPAAGVATNI